MAEPAEQVLFVGGPWDGQLAPLAWNDRDTVRVAMRQAMPMGLWTEPPLTTMEYRYVEYHRVEFHTPHCDFTFMVPRDLSPEDLMARLIVAYHQHKDCE
jgi:hypothetical protein